MDDYISRQDFRKELIDTPFHPRCETTPDLLTSVQDRLNDTLELLDNFPASDVRPVVRGEWVEDDYGFIHCSICGMEWDEPEHPKTNFCPNCGAKMGGSPRK